MIKSNFDFDVEPYLLLKEDRKDYCVCIRREINNLETIPGVFAGLLRCMSRIHMRDTAQYRDGKSKRSGANLTGDNRIMYLLMRTMSLRITKEVGYYHANKSSWAHCDDKNKKQFLALFVKEKGGRKRALTELEISSINDYFATGKLSKGIISVCESDEYKFYDKGADIQPPAFIKSKNPIAINLTDDTTFRLIYEIAMHGDNYIVSPNSIFIRIKFFSLEEEIIEEKQPKVSAFIQSPSTSQHSRISQRLGTNQHIEQKEEESSCIIL